MEHEHSNTNGPDRLRIVSRCIFFGFVAIAAYFLIAEHRAHVIVWLPFLLLAACPLLHFFHHRGHDHGDQKSPPSEPPGSDGPQAPPDGGHHH